MAAVPSLIILGLYFLLYQVHICQGACPVGFWGTGCAADCHCYPPEGGCDVTTGSCSQQCSWGWTNFPLCKTPCPQGLFGVGCQTECRCPAGDTCSRLNGLCSSGKCLYGYDGPGCQLRLAKFSTPPNITLGSATVLMVWWHPWSATWDIGDPPVGQYRLEYQLQDRQDWIQAVKVTPRTPEPPRYSYEMTNLDPTAVYRFRMRLPRLDNGKLGNSVPGPETLYMNTACTAPRHGPVSLSALSQQYMDQSVQIRVQWEPPPVAMTTCDEIVSHRVVLTCYAGQCPYQSITVPAPENTLWIRNLPLGVTIDIEVFSLNEETLLSPPSPSLHLVIPAVAPTTVKSSAELTTSTSQSLSTESSTSEDPQTQPAKITSTTQQQPEEQDEPTIETTTPIELVPENLRLVWKTETSIKVEWDGPVLESNEGYYKVSFVLANSFITSSGLGLLQRVIMASETHMTLAGLLPSSSYDVTVGVVIGGVLGPATSRTFWTEPESPFPPQAPEIVKISNKTVELKIFSMSFTTGPFTGAQIIVDRVSEGESASCVNQKEIHDFHTSQEEGVSCYVTGVIDPEILSGSDVHFVVGTGTMTARPYYNALLKDDNVYNIWLSVVTTLDGVTKRASTKVITDTDFTVAFVKAEHVSTKASTSNSMVIAVVFLVLFLMILALALCVLFYKRKKEKSNFKFKFPDILTYHRGPTLADLHTHHISKDRLMDISDNRFDVFPNIKIQRDPVYGHKYRAEQNTETAKEPMIEEEEKDHQVYHPTKTNEINTRELEHYIVQRERSDYPLKEEYKRLPGGFTSAATAGLDTNNIYLNRSTQVLPFNDNRVQLTGSWKFMSDYINASFVKVRSDRCYIVTQAPLQNTIEHFWSMIWDYQVEKIVMLMDLKEENKTQADPYWPEKDIEMYGQFIVYIKGTERRAHFTSRKLVLQLKGQEQCRTVYHYQFHCWMKGGVPGNTLSFLSFLSQTQQDVSPGSMSAVHCHTGGGRSGAFIAIASLLEEGKETDTIDILQCVTFLRLERVNQVSTFTQYRFIHECLKEAFCRPDMGISRAEFRAHYNQLLHRTDSKGKTMLAHEFEELNHSSINNVDYNYDNGDKRFVSPTKTNTTNDSKLIMTVLDSVTTLGTFLVTRNPTTKDHIHQMWDAIYEQKIHCVVMLGTWDEGIQYWPNDSSEESYGPYRIKNISVKRDSHNFVSRQFHVMSYNSAAKKPLRVKQLQFSQWPPQKNIPNVAVFMELQDLIQAMRHDSKRSSPVLIHCSDGVKRSGLFCMTWLVVERLRVDNVVDVFRMARCLRSSLPGVITCLEQYRFCYRALKEYMKRQSNQAQRDTIQNKEINNTLDETSGSSQPKPQTQDPEKSSNTDDVSVSDRRAARAM